MSRFANALPRTAGALTCAALVVALTTLTSGCTSHRLGRSAPAQANTSSSVAAPAGGATAAAAELPASSQSTGQPAGQPAPAAQASTDLAAVANDLRSIDAGTAQADNDLSAGDSARATDDNG
jgi:hypothetical protein